MSTEVKVTTLVVTGILAFIGMILLADKFGAERKHRSYEVCIEKYTPSECAQSLK
jgi:hypothetical protein